MERDLKTNLLPLKVPITPAPPVPHALVLRVQRPGRHDVRLRRIPSSHLFRAREIQHPLRLARFRRLARDGLRALLLLRRHGSGDGFEV